MAEQNKMHGILVDINNPTRKYYVTFYPEGNGGGQAEIEEYVNQKIAELVDGAPETLDTLKEIADLLDSETNPVGILQQLENKADNTPVIDVDSSSVDVETVFLSNRVYRLGEISGTFQMPSLQPCSDNTDIAHTWMFTFTTDSTTAPTIAWPAQITEWNGGNAPTINAGKYYEITVFDGVAAFLEV